MLGMGDRKSCLPVQITYTRMHCKRGYCLHIRRKNPLILGCENFVPALAGLFCVALPRPWKSTTFCITICYASLATSLIEVKGSAKRWFCYANQEPLYGAGNSANLKPSFWRSLHKNARSWLKPKHETDRRVWRILCARARWPGPRSKERYLIKSVFAHSPVQEENPDALLHPRSVRPWSESASPSLMSPWISNRMQHTGQLHHHIRVTVTVNWKARGVVGHPEVNTGTSPLRPWPLHLPWDSGRPQTQPTSSGTGPKF